MYLGETALDKALADGHSATAEVLRQYGEH